MKAITLTQPWASLVAFGAKKIETRSWHTSYRGELAIHAAKGWTAKDRALVEQEPFKGALRSLTVETMPLGEVVAVAEMRQCFIMTDGPTEPLLLDLSIATVPEPERTFGGYERGRYAWMLDGARELPRSVRSRGKLGIYDLDRDVAEAVRCQLEDFEERAAIFEHDAGLKRAEAERLAFLYMKGA